MTTIILHNQSFLDLAIQHTGSVENAFLLALQNGKSLTDNLVGGEQLSLKNTKNNKDILSYYQSKKLQPATAITEMNNQPQGIDYWAIQMDFIVS